jgi:hypothetical protein
MRQTPIHPRIFAVAAPMALLCLGCQSSAPATKAPASEAFSYPPRPTVAAPAFKEFHRDNDTYTLVTKEDATDAEITAILWQLRDAARDHAFDKLHLSQAFIDARKPKIWFHVYRGSKCASEKYTKGKLPCEPAYHGAGDFTLGSLNNSDYDDGELRHADGSETPLWDPEKPYTTALK